jgi:hypothetical protein
VGSISAVSYVVVTLLFGLPVLLLVMAVVYLRLERPGTHILFYRVLALNLAAVIGVIALGIVILGVVPPLWPPAAGVVVLLLWVAACVLPAAFVAYRRPVGWYRRLGSMALSAISTICWLGSMLVV